MIQRRFVTEGKGGCECQGTKNKNSLEVHIVSVNKLNNKLKCFNFQVFKDLESRNS